jgi:RNA polymerase sigma factor (sigma-70 family)
MGCEMNATVESAYWLVVERLSFGANHGEEPKDVVNVQGWLRCLLHNHCVNIRQIRRRHDHIRLKISVLSHLQPEGHPIVCESPEEVVSRQEILQNIHGAIGNLPPRLYETAKLRLIRDLSYREIATQLNLSPENTRKRMEQARCLLRTSLGELPLRAQHRKHQVA